MTYNITVRKEFEDGGIVDDFINTYPAGFDFRSTANAVPGYKRKSHKLDGVSYPTPVASIPNVQADHEVIFYYERGEETAGTGEFFTVRCNCLSEALEPVAGSTSALVPLDGDFTDNAPEIAGYTCIGHRVNGGPREIFPYAHITHLQADQVVDFIYEKNNNLIFTITESYYDTGFDTYFLPATTQQVEAGSYYFKPAPTMDGYTLIGYRIDGVEGLGTAATIYDIQSDHQVTFVYQNDQAKSPNIFIGYEFDGVPSQEGGTVTTNISANFRWTAPAFAGYRRTGHRVDGAFSPSLIAQIPDVRDDHQVIFLYESGEEIATPGELVTLYVNYLDERGSSLLPYESVLVPYDGDYQQSAAEISGYSCVGHRVDGDAPSHLPYAALTHLREDAAISFLYEKEGGGENPGVGEERYKVELKVTACCTGDELRSLTDLLGGCKGSCCVE